MTDLWQAHRERQMRGQKCIIAAPNRNNFLTHP